ncbi:MAG: ABC transporter permease subunit [Verrucomicrobiota bacterium]
MSFPRFQFNPQTRRKLARFRSLRRGYWSFLALTLLALLTVVGELLVNSRALIVRYEGKFYFPTYTAFHPGSDFGEPYDYETNYRALKARFAAEDSGNWVLLPPVPYNPYENDFRDGIYPPTAPSAAERHYLGTDTIGRDILARLFYGFRNALIFSAFYISIVYGLGILIGCLMAWRAGWTDLLGQRAIEIWSNLPFLYIVIIVASVIRPDLTMLIILTGLFSWTGMTYYFRTATYREKARDYVAAAEVLGASTSRILFRHILPNTISTLVTFIPFTLAGAITALTSLDFLGFGLPPPTPSWGELLQQGTANLNAPWIVASAFGAMVIVLTLVTFVGEAIRDAFDPKKFTTYQ